MKDLEEGYQEVFLYYSKEIVGQPNNERTMKLQKERMAREEKRRLEEEKREKVNKEKAMRDREKQREADEKRRAEMERTKINKMKKDEEVEDLKDIKGTFATIVENCLDDRTPIEMAFSGWSIPTVKLRIIFKALESNTSLKELVINRKELNDDEGCDLAKSLEYNASIERLSLEGNLLGPKFLEGLAETLAVNSQLRVLDIEGNNLTKGNNEAGVEALCRALKLNTTVSYLNLNNTCLTNKSAELIRQMLEINDRIIHIDIEKNPLIKLDTARAIQKKLLFNRELFTSTRKAEWQERKEMIYEEGNIKKMYDAREEELRSIKEIQRTALDKQMKREMIFMETLKEKDEDRKRMEKKIAKEAIIRAKAKKKRKVAKK